MTNDIAACHIAHQFNGSFVQKPALPTSAHPRTTALVAAAVRAQRTRGIRLPRRRRRACAAADDDGLDVLLPQVAGWFRATTSARPTPPQRLGWPAIAAGRNTLIFAPTGSGKTLAAFLACLDHLWRNAEATAGVRDPLRLAAEGAEQRHLPQPAGAARRDPGRRREPLARRLPPLRVAVRTGDTPAAERQRLGPQAARHPDHHARIAAPDADQPGPGDPARGLARDRRRDPRPLPQQARASSWRSCSNGSRRSIRRASSAIGLSATQRPLDEVARYLGGLSRDADSGGTAAVRAAAGHDRRRRPAPKDLDLEVIVPRVPAELGPVYRRPARSGRRSSERLLDADRRAPLDDRLRQQPPGRRAS